MSYLHFQYDQIKKNIASSRIYLVFSVLLSLFIWMHNIKIKIFYFIWNFHILDVNEFTQMIIFSMIGSLWNTSILDLNKAIDIKFVNNIYCMIFQKKCSSHKTHWNLIYKTENKLYSNITKIFFISFLFALKCCVALFSAISQTYIFVFTIKYIIPQPASFLPVSNDCMYSTL